MKFNRIVIKGFTLVEITMAVGVVGFGLLAIFGLLPVALASSRVATEQTSATGIVSAVVADLRATPESLVESSLYEIAIPANPTSGSDDQVLYFDGEGNFDHSVKATSRFKMTIRFVAGDHARAATRARLRVSWPARAPSGRDLGSVETFVALDRN